MSMSLQNSVCDFVRSHSGTHTLTPLLLPAVHKDVPPPEIVTCFS
jgi:hypothetical protein